MIEVCEELVKQEFLIIPFFPLSLLKSPGLRPGEAAEGHPCLDAVGSACRCWGGTVRLLPWSVGEAAAKDQVKHLGLTSFV